MLRIAAILQPASVRWRMSVDHIFTALRSICLASSYRPSTMAIPERRRRMVSMVMVRWPEAGASWP
jgi:hypothetical protein